MSNDTTKPDTSKIFPNGVYYWHGSIQIDPLSAEGQTIITILNQQKADRASQTTTPVNPNWQNPLRQAICYIFDIHTEKGASKIGEIFSSSDFELLKQDTHIMAVVNINTILSTPNDTYANLKPWIVANSIYVPPTL